MVESIKQISHVVEQQFPSFYRAEGQGFIAFTKAYYEWMEQQDGLIRTTRELKDNFDIDTTLDQFLQHFKDTYMVGLPLRIIGNQRLLQKHILDLYRTKNSRSSLELLFRLLYNESMELYIPSKDIFRLSDGKWRKREYIEIDYQPYYANAFAKEIIGATSGAKADVVNIEIRTLSNREHIMLFVENLRGTFLNNETLYFDDARQYPLFIRGSVSGFDVTYSSPSWNAGEEVYLVESDIGDDFQGAVASTYTLEAGTIVPVIEDGGYGYSSETVITVSQGANTTGVGAEFAIGALANTTDIILSNTAILPVANVPLDANNFGLSANVVSNMSSVLYSSLECRELTIGAIESLIVVNPGFNYDANVVIQATDDNVTKFKWAVAFGPGNEPFLGNNAVIDNYAAFGQGMVNAIAIRQSGFGYSRDSGLISLRNASNTKFIRGTFSLSSIGKEFGTYLTDDSWPSSNKRLQDSYYFQEYSYEVRSSKSLDQYVDVLKSVVHPAGNIVFGAISITDTNQWDVSVIDQVTVT